MNVQDADGLERQPRFMPTLVILLAAQAMAGMDGSILVVASPSLHSTLGASGADVQLVVAMYTLVFGALVVTGARLGDVVGQRKAFVGGLAAFTVFSLAGGLAPSPAALIVVRGLQGAAGAVMTSQVLVLIQTGYEGEARARAIGAYSMILAVGVAAGQIIGGLLVSAHLLAAAWRPALLVNVPVGLLLLAGSRRGLPDAAPVDGDRLDLPGAGLVTAALLALVVPIVLGPAFAWPLWVWPCLAACGLAASVFTVRERRLAHAGARPLLDLTLLGRPGVTAGVLAVAVVMAAYGGFVLVLTLYLQDIRHLTPLQAGLTCAVYASGFAVASLGSARLREPVRDRLPPFGALTMAAALVAVGLIAGTGQWPLDAVAPLLLLAGAGHAAGFSPLADRLTSTIELARASDLSGLILTTGLIGQVIGVAAFTGIYLNTVSDGAPNALRATTLAIGGALVACAVFTVRGSARAAEARADTATRSSDVPTSQV